MKKNNNKGFTMVELIIVIAILAILMVALVPTYVKYVESARVSNDQQIETGIEGAVEVAIIDPEVEVAVDDTVTWVCDTGAIASTNPALFTAVAETIGYPDTTGIANDEFDATSTEYSGKTYTFKVGANGVTVAGTTTP